MLMLALRTPTGHKYIFYAYFDVFIFRHMFGLIGHNDHISSTCIGNLIS